jgi:hypothetical protein
VNEGSKFLNKETGYMNFQGGRGFEFSRGEGNLNFWGMRDGGSEFNFQGRSGSEFLEGWQGEKRPM